MDKATLDKLFPDWDPVLTEDTKGIDFDAPIKGKYIARIVGADRYTGTCKDGVTPYDFGSLKMQVAEDIEGDKSGNRFLSKTYAFIDGKYSTAEEEKKKLLNDLFTAGLIDGMELTAGTMEELITACVELADKTMMLTCYKTKGGKQAIKVVKEHVLTGKGVSEGTASNDDWEE